MIRFEPLTYDKFVEHTGFHPVSNTRGMVMYNDDVFSALLCVFCYGGINYLLGEFADNINKKGVILGWRMFKKLLEPGDYYTIRDNDIATSKGFLAHFEFTPINTELYVYRAS